MDNSLSVRTSLTVCIDMSHNVVTDFLFSCSSSFIVNIINISFKLFNLFFCNRKSQLHFCSCKSDPQASPCSELLVSGKNILHFLTGISCTERTFVTFCVVHKSFYSLLSIINTLLYHEKNMVVNYFIAIYRINLYYGIRDKKTVNTQKNNAAPSGTALYKGIYTAPRHFRTVFSKVYESAASISL